MEAFTLNIVLAAAVGTWLVVCVLIYKAFKDAAWLAAPTAASCLFLLGTTVAGSVLVREAFFLSPVWLAVFLLAAIHLYRARKEMSAREDDEVSVVEAVRPPTPLVKGDTYI